jgi:2-polyprenyl-6-methoxyphenol hydroxylase-like FAD-dependent oxidoreductase
VTRADVGIIGGGVAGSALALTLAKAGVSVVLVEREAVFRDRIRGEGIHPWGTREIEQLGLSDLIEVAARGKVLPTWRVYRDSVERDPVVWATIGPGAPPVTSVRHVELQNALIAAAQKAGAALYRSAQASLERTADGVRLHIAHDGANTDIDVRLVVGADGSHSATRTWLGGVGTRDPVHHYFAGGLFQGFALDPDAAHHASRDDGFAMVFPQTEGLARLYTVCTIEERERVKSQPVPEVMIERARAVLPDEPFPQWEAAGPAGFFPNAEIVSSLMHGDRAVLVGDAAGATDPSLGHGIALTLRDVRRLSELLLDSVAWESVPAAFAHERRAWFDAIRAHSKWVADINVGVGPAYDALRARVAKAREHDPAAGGWAAIFAFGPDGLVPTDEARAHFLGEDL